MSWRSSPQSALAEAHIELLAGGGNKAKIANDLSKARFEVDALADAARTYVFRYCEMPSGMEFPPSGWTNEQVEDAKALLSAIQPFGYPPA